MILMLSNAAKYSVFDCADGTLNRLHQSTLKVANISRIFITHMHADHVLGLVWVLAHLMSGVGTTEEQREATRKQGVKKKVRRIPGHGLRPIYPRRQGQPDVQAGLHIYGPAGLRELVRTNLTLTSVALSGAYAIHELLHEGTRQSVGCAEEDLHPNEAVGLDIPVDEDGVWRQVLAEGNGKNGKGWAVRAGPIEHRGEAVPCRAGETGDTGLMDQSLRSGIFLTNRHPANHLIPPRSSLFSNPMRTPSPLSTHLSDTPSRSCRQ